MDIDKDDMDDAIHNVDTLRDLQLSQNQLLAVCDLNLSVVLKFVMLGDGDGQFEEGVYYGTSDESGNNGWHTIVFATMLNLQLDEETDEPIPEELPSVAELKKTRRERWK